jgi:drug/metabolite transporter (DMT)-like permease
MPEFFHELIFLGFVGLFNLLSLWPFIIVLHYTGAEVFDPPSALTMGYLTANGLIGTVLSDLLWCKVVVLTSPLVATLVHFCNSYAPSLSCFLSGPEEPFHPSGTIVRH